MKTLTWHRHGKLGIDGQSDINAPAHSIVLYIASIFVCIRGLKTHVTDRKTVSVSDINDTLAMLLIILAWRPKVAYWKACFLPVLKTGVKNMGISVTI